MNVNRREFLLSSGAAFLVAGCRTRSMFGVPDLKFGVVSDVHVTTPGSCRLLERSLELFRRRGVDAVVVPGDLTDWGVKSGLVYFKRTWDRVFGGTSVVPLLCTGNHDWEGFRYGDITMEMHANGYSEDDRMSVKDDPGHFGRVWTEVFGEPFDWVRCRTVKGYDFVSAEYEPRGSTHLAGWMRANAGRFGNGRPFFFFQHLPIKGTTADSAGWADKGATKPVLDPFPNCVAITGHRHRPFIDERQIWQGAFTAIGAPSLSYACLPEDVPHENGSGDRKGKSAQAMQPLPCRRDLRGGEGFVVSVWSDKIVVERHDMEEDEAGAPAWVIPLPLGKAPQPFAKGAREGSEPVPAFPPGARLELETRNTENRSGHWTIVMNCEFPSAVVPDGSRVFDYEIRAVPKDGSAPLVKYFYSPAYAKMAKYEPARQRFWFDVAELPQDADYAVEVRARNCFGKASRPLVSAVWHGKPGLGKVAI
ncbi:MAG: metallophosphoesterase [Kiritimatiellae bacterium]|nr:metallophosphoesterase [Kiritimatiellia bacterium]